MREIAARMGRSVSTISRELKRGADVTGRYRPHDAQQKAIQRRRLHRPSRLANDQRLRDWVCEHLLAKWSPEQISRELRSAFPGDPLRWLATETIYQAVYRPDLGGLPRELPGRVLRRKRRYRYPRRSATARRSGPIVGGTPITERSASVVERVEPGHWEGDLIVGTGHKTSIVTLVERTARYTLLGHLPSGRGDSASVRDAVIKALAPLPAGMRLTLTWDRGTEMSRHREIAGALEGTRIYFCDPHSPWQRPSNEHTNGMLRDYFPKSTDLSLYDANELERVQNALNARPRGILDWDSPAHRFATLMKTPSVLRR